VYSPYNQRRGTILSFKSKAGQAHREHPAALLQDTGLQLYRPTYDFITFQTLIRKLQNLSSATATGAGLLKFCARC